MKTALAIFNGIQFHYYHVNRVFDWASQNEARIRGIFVHSDEEPREGYIFPSDIDPAERLFNRRDAEETNVHVIHAQMKLFTDVAKEKKVEVETEEFVNPSLHEMVSLSRESAIIFVDGSYEKSFLLACTSFKLKDLIRRSACPVELVGGIA